MTPFETVLRYYRFPERIVPHPLQVEAINYFGPLKNSGNWLDMGTGKTFVATAIMLYRKIMHDEQGVVIMPPILLRQWARWLAEITPAITVTEYRGTPSKRKEMGFDNDIVLTGAQIFKKEFKRFEEHFRDLPYNVFFDEANMLGNVGSDIHQMTYDFSLGHAVQPMTGTPMNNPMDAYAMLKFAAPGTYADFREFTNAHAAGVDFYGKPNEFKDLDLLRERMKINSRRILFEDMYPDAEEPLFIPTYYDLSKEHYKLYTKLAEDQLLLLPDGGKIDGTTANTLQHALGQIVCNWSHFSGIEANTAAAVEMIEQKLTELGDGKIVVFAHYKMTVALLKQRLKKYGAVTVNSEVTAAQKDKNVMTFCEDPRCRVIVIQFISGGKGLDGLQFASHDMFFAEPCQQPRDFHQAVARLKRLGQRKKVRVMMGIANGTTQVRAFKNLLQNDTLLNKVIRNKVDLRNAIYGINQ